MYNDYEAQIEDLDMFQIREMLVPWLASMM